MIKINLATRKSPVTIQSESASGLKGLNFDFSDIDWSSWNELPWKQLLAGVIVCTGYFFWIETQKQDEVAQLESTLAAKQVERDRYRKESGKIKEYEATKARLDQDEYIIKTKLDVIQKLISDRQATHRMLTFLSESIPKEVWLRAVRVEPTGVVFNGAALGYGSISDFMKRLSESAYFTEVQLKNTRQEGVIADDISVATFELTAKRRL